MERSKQLRYLRIALRVVGLLFVFGGFFMMVVWPAAWTWEPRQSEYEHMMLGIYASLGVFLLIASRDPMAHKSLIWFTIVSSLVHGGIMALQAIADPADRINLFGDVAFLFAVAIVLAALMPPGVFAEQAFERKRGS
jgi:hypothetical protein